MPSYPKTKKRDSRRSSRPTKRKFHGNRFTRESSIDSNANWSTSKRKLCSVSSDDVAYNPLHLYGIIEFVTVFGALTDLLICRKCKGDVKFEETAVRGFGFKLLMLCACGHREINSGPSINTGFEINRRIVFVMRLLGLGRQAINIFSGLMDLGRGMSTSTYDRIVQHIHEVAKSVFDGVCNMAVEEEKQKNLENERPATELKVSGDGSWKKRGFSSLYGVTTLIGHYSGKIVDLVIKSSYCQACIFWKKNEGTDEYTEWYEDHQEQCSITHNGSAGKMEVDAIQEMFSRSEEKFGVKYSHYIGDGDSKTYKAILDLNPYGDEFPVTKSECIGHVEKRMGTRLRNVKKKEKLGGKGKLTDVLIKKLTIYYGLAIRRNVNSVEDMKEAIMATLDHLTSTNKNPKHDKCPAGADSWCKWRKAEAAGTQKNFEHPPSLHPDVLQHLIPIYEDLSRDDLLTTCLGGHTQNSNESFNSTVWRLAPKHLNAGLKIIEIAAFIAVSVFNEGYTPILRMMNMLNIQIGPQAKYFAYAYDEQRVTRQHRRSMDCTKEARSARRMEMMLQNQFHEEVEDLLYGPGIAE